MARSLALCALGLSVLPAAAQWSHDGGSAFRTNFYTVSFPVLSGGAAHLSQTYSESEEDTVSMVEEQLLQSPLVASSGDLVLVQTDSCTIALLGDPAAGMSWLVPADTWSPLTDPNANYTLVEECEAAGMVLGPDDTVYFLDGRNRAVHALALDVPTQVLAWQWSVVLDRSAYSKSVMPLDASLLLLDSELWVPLKYSLLGSDGIAWVIDTRAGVTAKVAPLPTCTGRRPENEDYGNAAIALAASQSGVAQLSSSDCGLPLYSQGDFSLQAGPQADDALNSPFGFAMGQHSHPVSTGDSLFFWNFQDNVFSGAQRVCCWDTVLATPCRGWDDGGSRSGCTALLPVLNSESSADLNATFRFSWVAGGLLAEENRLFVATSGVLDEDPLARQGWASTLSVLDTTSGAILASYRTGVDIFNSAPLVVKGTDGAIVLLSTAEGDVLAFAATLAGVNAGPMWRSADLPAIPPEDIPASTYAFLSITPAGTLLATTSAGGVEWQLEKAYVSVQNGIFAPSGGGETVTATATASATATAQPPTSFTATASATASATATATATATARASASKKSTPSASASPSPSNAPPTDTTTPPPALTPGAAAAVALVVLGAAGAAGVYVYVTYFGGGPAVAAAWAAITGAGGGSGGGVATAGKLTAVGGERTGLLSQQAAASRFSAT